MVAHAADLSYDAGMDGFEPLPAEPLEPLVAHVEGSLGVTVTVRDLTGWLRGADGSSLLDPHRNSHQRLEVCRRGFAPACIRHCRHACSAVLRKDARPQSTRCWKSVREVLVPVIRHGSLQGYLFAGAWRDGAEPDGAWAAAWRRLPAWEAATAARTAALLGLLADSLWTRAEAARTATPPQDRAGRIRAFLRAHPGVGRAGLARHLGISPSRTSHAVREACGLSLQELITQERLATARRLLADGDLPVAEVGRQAGWGDAPHFTRIFKRRMGLSPGAWRAGQHLA